MQAGGLLHSTTLVLVPVIFITGASLPARVRTPPEANRGLPLPAPIFQIRIILLVLIILTTGHFPLRQSIGRVTGRVRPWLVKTGSCHVRTLPSLVRLSCKYALSIGTVAPPPPHQPPKGTPRIQIPLVRLLRNLAPLQAKEEQGWTKTTRPPPGTKVWVRRNLFLNFSTELMFVIRGSCTPRPPVFPSESGPLREGRRESHQF